MSKAEDERCQRAMVKTTACSYLEELDDLGHDVGREEFDVDSDLDVVKQKLEGAERRADDEVGPILDLEVLLGRANGSRGRCCIVTVAVSVERRG